MHLSPSIVVESKLNKTLLNHLNDHSSIPGKCKYRPNVWNGVTGFSQEVFRQSSTWSLICTKKIVSLQRVWIREVRSMLTSSEQLVHSTYGGNSNSYILTEKLLRRNTPMSMSISSCSYSWSIGHHGHWTQLNSSQMHPLIVSLRFNHGIFQPNEDSVQHSANKIGV